MKPEDEVPDGLASIGSGSSESVASGLRWMTLSLFGIRVVQAVRGLILARIIGPRDVGVFAAAQVFIVLISLFGEGLGAYLVYRGKGGRGEERSVALLALFGGVVGALAIVASAGSIARLYHLPEVEPVAKALAVVLVFHSIFVVVSARLRSDMRFRAYGGWLFMGEAVSLLVGVALALAGASIWALVVSTIASRGVSALGMWWSAKFRFGRPGPEWRTAWRRALRYGLTVAAGGVTWVFVLQGDNLVVGVLLGAVALGLYGFGYNYGTILGNTVYSVVGQVAFPTFSNAQRDPAQLRNHFLRFTRLTAVVTAPLGAIAVTFARPMVQVLLGTKWIGAVHPFQVFIVMGLVWALYPDKELLRALGRPDVELRVGLVAGPATLLAAWIGSHFGIGLVAALVATVFLVSAIVLVVICARTIGLPVRAALLEPLPYFILAIVTVSVVALVTVALDMPDWMVVFGGGAATLILYCVIVRWRLTEGWNELRELARSRGHGPVAGQGPLSGDRVDESDWP